eukprot:4766731-Amphidinium_carterae.1
MTEIVPLHWYQVAARLGSHERSRHFTALSITAVRTSACCTVHAKTSWPTISVHDDGEILFVLRSARFQSDAVKRPPPLSWIGRESSEHGVTIGVSCMR